MKVYSEQSRRRFRLLIDKRGHDDCWPWKGPIGNGKATFEAEGVKAMARRVAYTLSYGDPPKGTKICLTCDLQSCMNHNHMYAKPIRNDLGNGTKLCSDCRRPKIYSEFSTLPSSVDGYYNYCKACHRKRKRREYASGAAWIKKLRPRKYGLTPEDVDAMIFRQAGLCMICGTTGGKYGLGVDHDHATGTIRDMLCGSCNAGIAMFRHDPALLKAAIVYVRKWSEIIASQPPSPCDTTARLESVLPETG